MNVLTLERGTFYSLTQDWARMAQAQGIRLFIKNQLTETEGPDQQIYIEENDLLSLTKQTVQNLPSGNQERILRLVESLDHTYKMLRNQGLNPVNQQLMQEIGHKLVDLKLQHEFTWLINLLETSVNFKAHLKTAILCRLLAHQMGWVSTLTLNKLVTAALFANLGRDICAPDEDYAMKSVEILATNPKIHEDILTAVRHQNENNDGSGPLKIRRHYIHPLAKVLRLANAISFASEKNMKTLLKQINKETPNKFDTALVKASQKLMDRLP